MAKKMLIDATHAEETRVVVVDGNKVEEFDFESHSKRQLTGNIYLAKVTRVEPSLQAAFVEYGGNRHGFLAFSEIHPDYYQIPKEDREALLAEEAAFARAEDENGREKPKGRARSRRKTAAAKDGAPAAEDAVLAGPPVPHGGEGEPGPANRAAEAEALEDVPPPSAAAGDIDIEVFEEPDDASEGDEARPDAEPPAQETTADEPADAAAVAEEAAAEANDGARGEYESVGGDDVEEERRSQRARPMRRYKIQEVIKVRQILLVQVVKEERGNKGAALTTYLSLAGRYCVLMPNTARGGGISRKITLASDRKKLKDIASSLTVPEGAGLIIRTAGANRTKTEIKRDYEFLTRQWEQVRDLTLKSIAPCLIYEEGSLIKRAIRDLYSRDIDEILVDGERGYREAKDYMKMLMPSHAKNVKHYAEALPLYSRHQVEGYLAAMFNPVVQLKSGGYIVIDVTEALVAIDVNSGRATREASVEETALKTNLEAAEEAARQMRLRDLAGLIVLDFIDMDERKNNAAVEKRLKEKLKTDRARIQVGRISAFGLLEMSRQRLRPGMIEATTKACPHCHGTGRVRSDDSMALALLRELEEEGVRQRSKEVLIVAPVEIANYLLNQKREHVALIESRFGLSVRVEGDPSLISPDYRVERFKTASRIVNVPEPVLPAITLPEEVEEEEEAEEVREERQAAEGERGGKRRRRRRRRGGRPGEGREAEGEEEGREGGLETAEAVPAEAAAEPAAAEAGDGRRKSRRRSRGRDRADAGAEEPAREPAPAAPSTPFDEVIDTRDEIGPTMVEVPEANAPQRPPRRERVRKPAVAVLAEVPGIAATAAPAAEAEVHAEARAEAEPDDGFTPAAGGAEPVAADPVRPEVDTTGPEPAEAGAAEGEPAEAEAAGAAPPEGVPAQAEAAERETAKAETAEAETAEAETAEAETANPEAAGTAPVEGVPAETAAEPAPAEAGDDSRPREAGGDSEESRPRRRGWWSRALGGG